MPCCHPGGGVAVVGLRKVPVKPSSAHRGVLRTLRTNVATPEYWRLGQHAKYESLVVCERGAAGGVLHTSHQRRQDAAPAHPLLLWSPARR